ncbi:MAG: VTT domain-containing protein [Alphaproteobacteria bacterium]|nr:VTT domain-containing protein [Alphaproteobacteria bacterium]
MKKYLPLVLIVVLAIIAWFSGLRDYFSFAVLKENQQTLELYVLNNKIMAILIYVGLYILVVALSIPGATFMTLVGGFFFNQILGTFLVVSAATIGATILFLGTKLASRDLIKEKAGPWVQKMQKGFKENATYYLLTLRLIPIFPFVAINLVAAILQIPLRTFILGTFFGIMPGSFVYVSIGVGLHDVLQKEEFSVNLLLEPKILLAFIGLGILVLLPVLYKYYKKKKIN